jgi:hypothetical protein
MRPLQVKIKSWATHFTIWGKFFTLLLCSLQFCLVPSCSQLCTWLESRLEIIPRSILKQWPCTQAPSVYTWSVHWSAMFSGNCGIKSKKNSTTLLLEPLLFVHLFHKLFFALSSGTWQKRKNLKNSTRSMKILKQLLTKTATWKISDRLNSTF